MSVCVSIRLRLEMCTSVIVLNNSIIILSLISFKSDYDILDSSRADQYLNTGYP